mmetsp:Transcript_16671/g.19210  ORF Transcript_16671/g.19210 Transcript_16671/m.19210 type:complete len:154 (-) Transcript_16671:256-717(-)
MLGSKFFGAFTRIASHNRFFQSTTRILMAPKPGVASLEELTKFVKTAENKLVVVDVRNSDASKEPGDQKSLAVAPLPSGDTRPNALNLVWDRESNSMPLPPETLDKDTPLITHCGGGGRGQKARDFLESKGYTNVLNGAGPKETELWKVYGDK